MTVRELLDEMAKLLRPIGEPDVARRTRTALWAHDRLRACERCRGAGEWYSTDRGKEGSLRVTCHPCDCLREPGNARYGQDMSAHFDDGDEPIEPYSDGELTGF